MTLLSLITLLALATSSLAADLGELQVSPLPQGSATFVVRDPQSAVLVVQTTVNPLSFECNMGIIRVDNPNPGEYRLHLFAGTNMVTFKADGYLPLRERFYLEPKTASSVRVGAKKRGASVQERPEIKLIYAPLLKTERIGGSLDNRILNLDFSHGYVLLKPEAGKHRVRLVSEGRIWEKEFNLAIGDRVEDSVRFSAEVVDLTPSTQPGGLYISSPIPSIKVYLNDVFQGLTPLTLDSVPAGNYEVRLERTLFQPKLMEIAVKSLDYAAYEVSLVSNFGYFKIDSAPTGALLQIDGVERGLTPFTQQRVDAGTYLIRLSRPYFQPKDTTIEVIAGDSLHLTLKMTPRFGKLLVTSTPLGASVSVDGREVGVTPLDYDTLVSGYHLLTVNASHHLDRDDNFLISDGEQLAKHYDLVPNFATLNVLGSPEGAEVTIEGDEKVVTRLPLSGQKLNPGIYRVKVSHEGYRSFDDVALLDLNDNDTLVIDLERLTGLLQVSSSPQGAKILLDGEEVGVTPTFLHDIPTGWHSLRLDKSGFDIVDDSVTVKVKELLSIDWPLSAAGTKEWRKQRAYATLKSALVPGMGQISAGKWRGGLWLGAFAGALYFASEAKSDHQNQQDIYDRERAAYLQSREETDVANHLASTESAYKEMNDLNGKWSLYLGCSVGIYALQLTDAWLFGAGSRPHAKASPLQLGATIHDKTLMASLSFTILESGFSSRSFGVRKLACASSSINSRESQ